MIPLFKSDNLANDAIDKSNVLPYLPNPPVSFTLTITDLPFLILVTFSLVPILCELLAQVNAYLLYTSPLAVNRPWNLPPYQLTVCTLAGKLKLQVNAVNNTRYLIITSFKCLIQ